MESGQRRRLLKYVPRGGEQPYYEIAMPPVPAKRRTHSIGKYTPRAYLVRHREVNTTQLPSPKTEERPSGLFEYECRVKNSLEFPERDYKKLVSIVTKYSPAPVKLSALQALVQRRHARVAESTDGESFLPRLKAPSELHSIDTETPVHGELLLEHEDAEGGSLESSPLLLDEKDNSLFVGCGHIKRVRNELSKLRHTDQSSVESSADRKVQLMQTVINDNEKELAQILLTPSRQHEDKMGASFVKKQDEQAGDMRKQQMRKQWQKLQRKTLFQFDVDLVNDTVSMRRVQRQGADSPTKVKVRTKLLSAPETLSPELQRVTFRDDKQRKGAVAVCYTLGTPLQGVFSAHTPSKPEVAAMGTEMLWQQANARQSPKLYAQFRKLILEGRGDVLFDLNAVNVAKLSPSEFFSLYRAMKAATHPSFYSVDPAALYDLDPEVAELVLSKPSNEFALTTFDRTVLQRYRSYLVAADKGEVFSGFWHTKRVSSLQPVCREGARTVTIGDRVYLFGGTGADRLNDLWCLSEVNNDLWNWTSITLLLSNDFLRSKFSCFDSILIEIG